MHDEKMLDDVADKIRESAPPTPGADTMSSVLAAALDGAPRVAEKPARSRWMPRILMRPALAVAVVAVTLGVSAVALYRSQPTSGFAKEDALAALKPAAGQILHAVTRSYSVNPGDPIPAPDAMSQDEFWVDAAGNRSRSKSIETSTGTVLLDVLGSGGRFRAFGNGLLEPVDSGVAITSAYSNGSMLGMALGDYEYMRNSLPAGKVVGEVARAGEKYWDVRWTDVKDANGLTLSARALFRIPDYRPALLDRSYPGGATTHWEALKWEVVRESDVATTTFDAASIGKRGVLEENVWYPRDLVANVSYPAYWLGPKLGSRSVLMSSDGSLGNTENPLFFERLNGHNALDIAQDKSRTYIDYTASDSATVTVTSSAPVSEKLLAVRLGKLGSDGDAKVRASAIGTATVVASPDGLLYAGIGLDNATVIVATADSDALMQALQALKVAR